MTRKLSDLQATILVDILDVEHRSRERHHHFRADSLRYGIEIEPRDDFSEVSIRSLSPERKATASARACHSRALARLERRGLTERLSGYGGWGDGVYGKWRTGYVKLTTEGRELAERLTKQIAGDTGETANESERARHSREMANTRNRSS